MLLDGQGVSGWGSSGRGYVEEAEGCCWMDKGSLAGEAQAAATKKRRKATIETPMLWQPVAIIQPVLSYVRTLWASPYPF